MSLRWIANIAMHMTAVLAALPRYVQHRTISPITLFLLVLSLNFVSRNGDLSAMRIFRGVLMEQDAQTEVTRDGEQRA